jgi:hypothetical protein
MLRSSVCVWLLMVVVESQATPLTLSGYVYTGSPSNMDDHHIATTPTAFGYRHVGSDLTVSVYRDQDSRLSWTVGRYVYIKRVNHHLSTHAFLGMTDDGDVVPAAYIGIDLHTTDRKFAIEVNVQETSVSVVWKFIPSWLN